MINEVYKHFLSKGKEDFVTEEIIDFLVDNPDVEAINSMYTRNEGLVKSLHNDRMISNENI